MIGTNFIDARCNITSQWNGERLGVRHVIGDRMRETFDDRAQRTGCEEQLTCYGVD
jgi:hypothetical protein